MGVGHIQRTHVSIGSAHLKSIGGEVLLVGGDPTPKASWNLQEFTSLTDCKK